MEEKKAPVTSKNLLTWNLPIDQEEFQMNFSNLFGREYLNKWILYVKNKTKKDRTETKYLNSMNYFYN